MTTEKTAQGAKNPQFERSFADLAYAHLKDRAPKLLDFLVGFQVLDKNEDETKAAGVFGFKVGKQWFYAPVFFLNGELKGSELLYIKDKDAFVPLEENWVNYLISRKPPVLGEKTPYTAQQLGISAPDFHMYSDSPLRGWHKTSGYADYDEATANEVYGYWCEGARFDVRPAMRCLSVSVNDPVFKEAAARMDLSVVIPELGEKAAKFLVENIKQYPRFGKALAKFYSGSELMPKKAAAEDKPVTAPSEALLARHGLDRSMFRHYATKLAKSGYTQLRGTDKAVIRILMHHGVKSASHLREVLPTITADVARPVVKQAADPRAKVEVITRREAMDDPPEDITDAERSEIVEEGFMVRDDRTDTEKSKVYDIDMTQTLSNPQGSGLYEMISKDGKAYEVVIIQSPKTIGAGTANACLVLRTDNNGWCTMCEKDIIVRKDLVTDWKPFYDKLPTASSIEEGKSYVLIGPSGDSSLVFNVVEKAGNDLFVHVPHCSPSGGYAGTGHPFRGIGDDRWRPKIDHDYGTIDLDEGQRDPMGESEADNRRWWRHSVRKVVLSDRSGRLTPVGDTLLAPADCKVMPIKNHNSGLGFAPGTAIDAELVLLKDAALHALKLWSDGLGYQIDDGQLSDRMQRADAVRTLIGRYGVTKGAASIMLKRADDNGTDTFLVKYAQGYGGAGGPLIPGPTAPSVSVLDNTRSFDPELNAMVEYPQETFEDAGLPMASYEDYAPYKLDEPTAQAAIAAGNTGQKEVFDTSVLGSIVKTMDTDPVVDKYLSDVIIGEDRLGRLLFMFYWHNDKFRDRYGDDEMQELEDGLRNTFKSVGDLVLFLKKKSIEPDVTLTGSDVDLEDIS